MAANTTTSLLKLKDMEEGKLLCSPQPSPTTNFISCLGQRVVLIPTLIIICLSLWSFPKISLAFVAASAAIKWARRRKPVQFFVGDGGDADSLHNAGDYYEGEFNLGKRNGSGVYDLNGQLRYEGDWVDGHYDGYGIERGPDGSRYRGKFHRGLWHGIGEHQFGNGDTYAGQWVCGQSHGQGVLQSGYDGGFYAGQFKAGLKHGLGFHQFSNGEGYAGEYFNGMIEGFGVYQFANGDWYVGSWHEGARQGFGIYGFRKGDAIAGEWDYGTLKNFFHASHPAVLKSVQCGRNAAESAYFLPRVEEQVKQAICAANEAAAAARVVTAAYVRPTKLPPLLELLQPQELLTMINGKKCSFFLFFSCTIM